MWESIICPQDQFLEWHRRECLMGNYDFCGVDNMAICPIEEDGSSTSLMNQKKFFVGQIITKRGEEKKSLQFVYKSTISSELIVYLKPKLQFFACHNFVARWQDKMFKSCLENCPNDTIVSVVNLQKTTPLKFKMSFVVGFRPNQHQIRSNGYNSQFKNKVLWYFVN